MKDTETEIGLDKSILAAQYSLNTLIQRFREAEQTLPSHLLSQIIKLQESLEDTLEFRYPNLDWDVRVGLTSNGIEAVLDKSQAEERTLLSVITALSQPSSQIK